MQDIIFKEEADKAMKGSAVQHMTNDIMNANKLVDSACSNDKYTTIMSNLSITSTNECITGIECKELTNNPIYPSNQVSQTNMRDTVDMSDEMVTTYHANGKLNYVDAINSLKSRRHIDFSKKKYGPDEDSYHPGYPNSLDKKIDILTEYPSKLYKKLPEAPTFFPTHSEFAYPHEYIHSIIPQMEAYGIAKIVPPERYLNMMGLTYCKIKKRVVPLNESLSWSRNESEGKRKQDMGNEMQKIKQKNGNAKMIDSSSSPQSPQTPLTPQSKRKGNAKFATPNEIDSKKRKSHPSGFVQSSHWKHMRVNVKQQNIHQLMERVKCGQQTKTFAAKDKFFISKERPIISYKNTRFVKENTMNKVTNISSNGNNTIEKGSKATKRKAGTQISGKSVKRRLNDEPIILYCRTLESENISIPGADLIEMTESNFGFPRLPHVYNLKEFKKLADTFKWEYYNMKTFNSKGFPVLNKRNIRKLGRNPHRRVNGLNYAAPITHLEKQFVEDLISKDDIEQEYWRIVEHCDTSVIVQYGSDLDVNQVGSLFPRAWDNDWNMNRLALTKDCLLHYLHQKIPGVSSPMLYVGMIFSSFCWHTEDNYLPATNFLHFGANKTWYGVPGSAAVKFETVMKETLNHLYDENPNLIHGMITQLSPRLLAERGVPVFTVDHEPGTFVITLPRVFHAGFNHGFNIAESINLAPSCWVPVSRIAAKNYRDCKRPTAFSHDKIFCNAVNHLEEFDSVSAEAILNEFKLIVEEEGLLRRGLEEAGIVDIKPMKSGLRSRSRLAKNDADRDFVCCKICNQDCYLSTITCPCLNEGSSNPVGHHLAFCLYHANTCSCNISQKALCTRYSMKELTQMLESAEKKLNEMNEFQAEYLK